MSRHFAQISDPHLSTLAGVHWRDLLNKRLLGYLSWLRKRRHEHRPEVLQALRADLKDQPPDQLLVTGDLTHLGLPQEFRQALGWLRQLGEPDRVAVVPGNHDAYVAGDWAETFALWREYMASDDGTRGVDETPFPSLRVRGEIAYIGLSTATPKPPLLATGTLGAAQLERLPDLLEATGREGLFRVVYLHHPALPGEEKWRKRLTDAAALKAVLVEFGAELVLHGHGHRAHVSAVETRHGSAPVIAVPSASALGRHGADVALYNRYVVDREPGGWRLAIESRRFDPVLARFVAGGASARLVARED